jgi:hypothetical protein
MFASSPCHEVSVVRTELLLTTLLCYKVDEHTCYQVRISIYPPWRWVSERVPFWRESILVPLLGQHCCGALEDEISSTWGLQETLGINWRL